MGAKHLQQLLMGRLVWFLNGEAVRNPSMGRFRHRSLHVELKDGFRAASAFLS
jgi:hypothetical protein